MLEICTTFVPFHVPICQRYSYHLFPNWSELSPVNVANDPQEKGMESVWRLKNCTTASPELLVTVVTWNVRTSCWLQWNLSWVKDKCVLSSWLWIKCAKLTLRYFWGLKGRWKIPLKKCYHSYAPLKEMSIKTPSHTLRLQSFRIGTLLGKKQRTAISFPREISVCCSNHF